MIHSAHLSCLQEKEDAPYTREAQMSELVRKTATSLSLLPHSLAAIP